MKWKLLFRSAGFCRDWVVITGGCALVRVARILLLSKGVALRDT